jgi:hypothetical protein
MASLSGNTIQDTYDGLLKLNDSTQGISSSFESITDGLGNDTGTKIKENGFWSRTQLYQTDYKFPYYGMGIGAGNSTGGASVYGSPSEPRKQFQYFYDNGLYSYSAFSYNVATITSSNDIVEWAFYSAQYVDNIGIVPYQKLAGEFSLDLTSTGQKTITFVNPLKFEPGYNFLVYRVLNTDSPGSIPTMRLRSTSTPPAILTNQAVLGFTESDELNGLYYNPFGSRSMTSASFPIYNITGFPNTMTSVDINTGRLAAAPNTTPFAFLLHTIF